MPIYKKLYIFFILLIIPIISQADLHSNDKISKLCERRHVATFEKDKLIVMTMVKLKDKQELRFTDDYLAHANEIAKYYGGEQLVKLNSYHIVVGDLRPENIFFSQWPSLEMYRAYLADPNIQILKDLKQEVTRLYQVGLFSTSADTTVNFCANKMYEAFGAEVNPDNSHLIPKFFNAVLGLGINKYGRNQVLDLQPIQAPEASYTPHLFGIAEWPNSINFFGFTDSEIFQNAVRKYRTPALDRLDMINTFVDFKERPGTDN